MWNLRLTQREKRISKMTDQYWYPHGLDILLLPINQAFTENTQQCLVIHYRYMQFSINQDFTACSTVLFSLFFVF